MIGNHLELRRQVPCPPPTHEGFTRHVVHKDDGFPRMDDHMIGDTLSRGTVVSLRTTLIGQKLLR